MSHSTAAKKPKLLCASTRMRGARSRESARAGFVASLILALLTVGGGCQSSVISGPDSTNAQAPGSKPESRTSWTSRFARSYAFWASSRVQQLKRDRTTIRSRIQSLPPYSPQMNLGAGFHSSYAENQDSVRWVQVDLGAEYEIDTIVLVPTYVRRDDANVAGYGFPRQFRVDVSNDPEFSDSVRVYESLEGVPNPGKYPFLIRNLKAVGRYVRVTCTELTMDGDHAFFALAELMVLSGPRNVALWRPLSSSDTVEAELRWSIEYLVDEISPLPLATYRQLSPTDGYQSPEFDQVDTDMELIIDLGELQTVEEVRLVPALPLDRPDIPGWGFPQEFSVELLESLDAEPTLIYDARGQGVRHWLHRPFVIPVASRSYFLDDENRSLANAKSWNESTPWDESTPIQARYVRVRVTKLDDRIKPYYLAFSEIEVFDSLQNVAFERPVTVKQDGQVVSGDSSDFDRWNASFLTDGYGSRRRLMALPAWLAELDELKGLETRANQIDSDFEDAVNRIWSWNLWSIAIMMTLALFSAALYNRRLRKRHRQHAERLRNQIASDLHDDIGSNLGTIGLLCDSVGKADLSDGERRALFDIREIATETSDAMRDILWIIDPTSTRLEDFVGRLRGVSKRLLISQESAFTAPDAMPDCIIPLPWRRNMFLSIKEVLHNAAKHSQSDHVDISVTVERGEFRMRIKDNGVGFDIDSRKRGFGIRNISRRLKELGGAVTYDSVLDEGTTVELQAPLPTPAPS